MNVPERQDDPVFLRQALNEPLHEVPPGFRFPLDFGTLHGIFVRDRDLADILERDFPHPAALAQNVPDMVDGDPVEPGAELGSQVELGKGQIGLQKTSWAASSAASRFRMKLNAMPNTLD